jgi:hypothetical protein
MIVIAGEIPEVATCSALFLHILPGRLHQLPAAKNCVWGIVNYIASKLILQNSSPSLVSLRDLPLRGNSR